MQNYLTLFSHANKILSIGNAGGGKSTICRALSNKLNISMYPIDHILWKPGWVSVPLNEYAQKSGRNPQY